MNTQDGQIILTGTVESITFQSEDSGYTVLELATDSELVVVVGILPFVCAGEHLTVKGKRTYHKTYGDQFAVESCERQLPTTAATILRYLSSGAIKGIGPSTAVKIVERFGDSTISVLENEPLRLSAIKGITPAKAKTIGAAFKSQFGIRAVIIRLSELRITVEEAMRIYKKYGDRAADTVSENPYILCNSGLRISFERADEIAKTAERGIPIKYRIKAGLTHVLSHNTQNGHTCLPPEKVVATAAHLLDSQPDYVQSVLDEMIADGELFLKTFDRDFIYLPRMLAHEEYCANRIMVMQNTPQTVIPIHKNRLIAIEEKNGILYDACQKEAISDALSKGMLALTGGPGTGKTTTLNAIITLLSESGQKILLAAPTGRAAKRMTELTGHEAKTLHRLLEVDWMDGDAQKFAKNEKSPLECDVIIIDEMSMMDISLFEAVLKALPLHCRVIMVGDVDQLPSVGAGNVFGDIIDSGVVPTVRLQTVFRQAAESYIVSNAHRILHGDEIITDNKTGDFFIIRENNPDRAAEKITDLVTNRLPNAYNYSPKTEIQVLCPSRKRTLGTGSLNLLLQQKINPPAKNKNEWRKNFIIYREGDKVMQIKNDYEIELTHDDGSDSTGIYNGDIGEIVHISTHSETVKVRFDDRVAVYNGAQMENLELAYAATIHKSQGSEFDCVVLPLLDMPPPLCYRNLLYTAVTRAKKHLIIVGSDYVIKQMIDNNKKTNRYTGLRYMLEKI